MQCTPHLVQVGIVDWELCVVHLKHLEQKLVQNTVHCSLVRLCMIADDVNDIAVDNY